ncbi:MAG: ABC transporter ATP-binding protein [Actinobacteria bacterium]|nr:ABC transporter ATP-binding protein [Actinomycetota bacterium]
MPLLDIANVSKSFGGLDALKDVNFAVHQGQIKALIGPNGAGKTTVFNLISGSYRPSAGRVVFGGVDLTRKAPHAICRLGVGRTFQHSLVFDGMTVLENVTVGRHCRSKAGVLSAALSLPLHRREEREAFKVAGESLRRVGLEGKADEFAGNLPMGERHLLEIARALATEPKMLLLDEPAAGLNEEETERLAETVRRIRSEGITVLLVEHHMGFVMEISDEVVVLDYGRKIAEGPPLMIMDNDEVVKAYLGEALE